MLLEGKSAFVTGGGRGLGRAIAIAYAREGADVAVVARTPEEVDETAQQVGVLGRKGMGLIADLTDTRQTANAFSEAVRELGKIDILVNNAGGYRLFTDGQLHGVPFLELTEEEWDRVIAANLTTAFRVCKAVLPHMVARGGGAVVNMSSGAGRRGAPGQAAYSASKAAMDKLSEALAEEMKQHGIAVNSLTPGWVLTRPNDDYDSEVHKRMRLPEDIGPVAVFLALQTPDTMTGQMLSAPDFDRERGIEPPSAYERLYSGQG